MPILKHLLALALLPASTLLAANPLRVKTDKGPVEGVYTADQKVVAFKGIPYAAPPLRGLRWQPPQPAAKWPGVLAAKDFGSHCIQSVSYPDMTFHDPGPSEDCLTLNVWTPANAKPHSLPVMVWVYGGGFAAGSTSENRQDGQFLAHRNVVIVSMNYRLGIFGFFAHPALSAESPHHASGNYGLLDQAAALAWVKRNISAFGGDPNNITLFGESAGSFSVSALMASPLSKDLIRQAIGESGAAFGSSGLRFEPREVHEQRNLAFSQAAFHTTAIADLRNLPADTILAAATAKTPGVPRFGPDVDGYFLPQSVPDLFAAGKQAHVPLLAGWNANEGGGLDPKVSAATFTATAQQDFGPNAPAFLALYPATTDDEARASSVDYAGHRFIAFSTWLWLEAQSKIQTKTGTAPVYRYFFALPSPGDDHHTVAQGAFHSDDIEYVFGTLDSRPGAVWRPEDRRLSNQMGTWWTNFARTGDPNGSTIATLNSPANPIPNPNGSDGQPSPDLPHWPTYNATTGWQVMILDAKPEPHTDDQRARLLFLTTHPPNPRTP